VPTIKYADLQRRSNPESGTSYASIGSIATIGTRFLVTACLGNLFFSVVGDLQEEESTRTLRALAETDTCTGLAVRAVRTLRQVRPDSERYGLQPLLWMGTAEEVTLELAEARLTQAAFQPLTAVGCSRAALSRRSAPTTRKLPAGLQSEPIQQTSGLKAEITRSASSTGLMQRAALRRPSPAGSARRASLIDGRAPVR